MRTPSITRLCTVPLLAMPFLSCAGPPATAPIVREAPDWILRDAPGHAPARRVAAPVAPAPPPRTENVILVTLDGVRWQEIFGGVDPVLADRASLPKSSIVGPRDLVPNLYRLFFVEGTAIGAPEMGDGIAASGPRFVSLPAYLEIMTGAPSTCWTNDCQPDVPWTLAEEIGSAPGSEPDQVAVFASWDRIGRAVSSPRVLVSAGRGQNDAVPAYPGSGAYRPDHQTAALAIAHLVQHRPRLLWVALGDTDEWAHKGDYRGYLGALAQADAFVGELAGHLAEMGDYGLHTTVLVTTDHGRDDGFADHGGKSSAAVWLLARGGAIVARGPTRTRQRRYLRDLAPTILTLLDRPLDACVECGNVIGELL